MSSFNNVIGFFSKVCKNQINETRNKIKNCNIYCVWIVIAAKFPLKRYNIVQSEKKGIQPNMNLGY